MLPIGGVAIPTNSESISEPSPYSEALAWLKKGLDRERLEKFERAMEFFDKAFKGALIAKRVVLSKLGKTSASNDADRSYSEPKSGFS